MKKKLFTKAELTLLFLLAFIQFSHIVDFMLIMPLGPQLMRLLKVNAHEFGLLVSVYNIAAGVSGLLATYFVDRFDRKKILVVLYFGFTLGTIGCGLANSYYPLLLMRFVTGIFGGVLTSMVIATVGDIIDESRRATAMGIIMLGFSLASILGVPIGVWTASYLGWQAPFLVLGGISAVGILLCLKTLPKLPSKAESLVNFQAFIDFFSSIWSNLNARKAIMLNFLITFGQFSIIPFISPSMALNLGFTDQQLGFIYLFGGLVTIVCAPMIGRFADLKGKAYVFKIFAWFSLVPFILITMMNSVPVWLALVVTCSFFLSVTGRMVPITALTAGVVKPEQRGRYMALVSCGQQLASALASLLAGFIVYTDTQGKLANYGYMGLIGASLTLVSLILIRSMPQVLGFQNRITDR